MSSHSDLWYPSLSGINYWYALGCQKKKKQLTLNCFFQLCCICCNPESKQTHSLHNNWYGSSFLKGKDEQRRISGSPGVTHTHTSTQSSSSSSRMTNTRWQAPRVHTRFSKVAHPNWKPGLRGHPFAQNTSEQEVRLRRRAERPELRNKHSPSHVKHNQVSTERSALQNFKYNVLKCVSALLG